MSCEHLDFISQVKIFRLEDNKRFMAEITIVCIDCNKPMLFHGLPYGMDVTSNTMSIDQTEARLTIRPQDEEIPPLLQGQIRGFSIQMDKI